MWRRSFLQSAITAAGACRSLAQAGPPTETFVYKKAGCEIKADVIGPAAGGGGRAVMWIHGGALISGSRRLGANSRLLGSLLDAGFRVISIDYRLAPETKLPGIIEDIEDAWRWLRDKAGALGIDADRIGVCGGSAGGYLTLMMGFRVKPRPKAMVSYWGYGDITGAWYSRPDPFYRRQPEVSREEALAAVGREALSEPPEKSNRGRFYLYCRQQGLWPKEVAGRDPDKQNRWFDAYSPIRNVTAAYPPTMLVHGTADTDVPYQQSKMMAEQFRRAGVQHQLVTVEGGGHGIGNIPAEQQARIYKAAAEFLKSAA
jgi:acetyl esterase/lipase